MIQMTLDPEKCNFDLESNGDASAEVKWKLCVNPTSNTIEIARDESRERYFEAVLQTWNEASDDPAKRASVAMKALEEYEKDTHGEMAPKTIRSVDGEEIELDPQSHSNVLKSAINMEERQMMQQDENSENNKIEVLQDLFQTIHCMPILTILHRK